MDTLAQTQEEKLREMVSIFALIISDSATSRSSTFESDLNRKMRKMLQKKNLYKMTMINLIRNDLMINLMINEKF